MAKRLISNDKKLDRLKVIRVVRRFAGIWPKWPNSDLSSFSPLPGQKAPRASKRHELTLRLKAKEEKERGKRDSPQPAKV